MDASIDVALEDALWIVVISFVMAFVVACALGANDVANAFGTSVGSGVLTLRQACVLGTIFETAGAILLGSTVSDTIRKGIIDPLIYNGSETELMVGELCALAGSASWVFMATAFSLPVSVTHSVVGATLGFSLVARGTEGVVWEELIKIVISWFISPLLSGIFSFILFWVIRKTVLDQVNTLARGLIAMPICFACVIALNLFAIFYEGTDMLGFDKIPWWGALTLSIGTGVTTGIIAYVWVRPYLRNKILTKIIPAESLPKSNVISDSSAGLVFEMEGPTPGVTPAQTPADTPSATPVQTPSTTPRHTPSSSPSGSPKSKRKQQNNLPTIQESTMSYIEDEFAKQLDRDKSWNSLKDLDGVKKYSQNEVPKKKKNKRKRNYEVSTQTPDSQDIKIETEKVKDKPESAAIFKYLQILSAVFDSFVHGGNDVSNAIGPVIAIYAIWIDGEVSQKSSTPIWILLYGGAGISVGLVLLGRRVMKTIGERITAITPSSGFSVEVGAAVVVLLASHLGIPVSTTHCQVGSVVAVGWLRSKQAVDWRLLRNIILAWVVTVPCAGAFSAAFMSFFLHVL